MGTRNKLVTLDDLEGGDDQVMAALAAIGGPSSRLTPATPDHVFNAGLPAGFTLGGSYVAGDVTDLGDIAKFAARAAGSYIYAAAPAGDWTCVMKAAAMPAAATNAMFGLIAVDNSSNGLGGGTYNSTPNGPFIGTLAAGVYNSANFAAGSYPLGSHVLGGVWTWYKLRKASGAYYLSLSLNGEEWGPEITINVATTLTRVGFGYFSGGGGTFLVKFVDFT